MQKTSLILISALLLSAIALFNLQSYPTLDNSQSQTFNLWKTQFNKIYKSDVEQYYRFNLFNQNLLFIQQHNSKYQKGQTLSTLTLNQFSDLTVQEFKNIYLSAQIPTEDFVCKGPQYQKKTSFNQSFSTNASMLTSVGEQGQCTAGYAFATSSAVEASMFKTIKSITQLSAQQLIDCSNQTANTGCSGGTPLNALHYLINRGAMKSADYSYTGKTDTCRYSASKKVWEVQNCTKVDSDLIMLKSQILEQPVIVGFEASDQAFINHGAGLYTPAKCGTKINHYMLAVGWGQETTTSVIGVKTVHYYIVVKNSFGIKWGDSGYGKIVIQQNKKENNGCGMLTSMYFPYG